MQNFYCWLTSFKEIWNLIQILLVRQAPYLRPISLNCYNNCLVVTPYWWQFSYALIQILMKWLLLKILHMLWRLSCHDTHNNVQQSDCQEWNYNEMNLKLRVKDNLWNFKLTWFRPCCEKKTSQALSKHKYWYIFFEGEQGLVSIKVLSFASTENPSLEIRKKS